MNNQNKQHTQRQRLGLLAQNGTHRSKTLQQLYKTTSTQNLSEHDKKQQEMNNEDM